MLDGLQVPDAAYVEPSTLVDEYQHAERHVEEEVLRVQKACSPADSFDSDYSSLHLLPATQHFVPQLCRLLPSLRVTCADTRHEFQ